MPTSASAPGSKVQEASGDGTPVEATQSCDKHVSRCHTLAASVVGVLVERLISLLVPPACLVCRVPLRVAGESLCVPCRAALPWLGAALCPRCALPRPCSPCPARASPWS